MRPMRSGSPESETGEKPTSYEPVLSDFFVCQIVCFQCRKIALLIRLEALKPSTDTASLKTQLDAHYQHHLNSDHCRQAHR